MADVSAHAPIFRRGSAVLDYWLVHAEGLTVQPLGARVEEVVVAAPVGRAEALIVRSRDDAPAQDDPRRVDRLGCAVGGRAPAGCARGADSTPARTAFSPTAAGRAQCDGRGVRMVASTCVRLGRATVLHRNAPLRRREGSGVARATRRGRSSDGRCSRARLTLARR